MRVKICGITNSDDALAAAQAGADFVGLILAASSRRVDVDAAKAVIAALPTPVVPVLVFRDAPVDKVVTALDAAGTRWAQLHGAESVAYLTESQRRRPDVRVIKTWEVSANGKIEPSVEALVGFVRDALDAGVDLPIVLLDAPKGGPHPGHERMAAHAAACHALPVQVWCAGGLTPNNVAGALAGGEFDGVDVASGVEVRPGVKDRAAIRRFVENARRSAPPPRA